MLTSSAKHASSYRPDIDGLRAISVLLVLGFHAFPSLVGGGFIGVDVFFVISGYLITGIILGELATGSFRFTHFYARRIRRIFPALILVLLFSAVVGFQILQIDELKRLEKHISASTVFILNYVFLGENGYFDSTATAKPLLHLWSLGVEEQFYLIWPLLMVGMWRAGKRLLLPTLLLAALSFGWNISQISSHPAHVFYSIQTRFWELSIGSLLACALSRDSGREQVPGRLNGLCAWLGAGLIAMAVVVVRAEKAFPGWWALMPTVGACLLIAAGPQTWVNKNVLSQRVLVRLGLISFPLYLWHWPLLSFAWIAHGGPPPSWVRLLLVALAFIFAELTYRFVETPIRQGRSKRSVIVVLCGLMSLIGVSSYLLDRAPWQHASSSTTRDARGTSTASDEAAYITGYTPAFKTKEQFYAYYANEPSQRWLTFFEKNFRHECNFYQIDQYYLSQPTEVPKTSIADSCFVVDSKYDKRVMLWGDSHAQMLNIGLRKTLPDNWQILQVTSSGCAPSVSNQRPSDLHYCLQSNWFALKVAREAKPDVVILAQSVNHRYEDMRDLAVTLKSFGVKQVIFVGPAPHWQDDLPKIMVRQLWPSLPMRTWVGVDKTFQALNETLKHDFENSPTAIYIDTMALFCNQDGCLTRLHDETTAELTSWDRGHLTPSASEYLAKQQLLPTLLKAE